MPIFDPLKPQLIKPALQQPKSPGQAGEAPKELPPEPVEPTEYYTGYGRQFSAFQEMLIKSQKRLQSAEENWAGYAGGPFRANVFLATMSAAFFPSGLESFEAQREVAKAELDAATQEYSRMAWRLDVLTALPYMVADSTSPANSVDDILAAFPNEFLTEGDKNWLRESFDKLQYLAPAELPEGYTGSREDMRQRLLEEVLAEPKMELKALHNLTVDELMKTIQPISAEIPQGMTTNDVRSLLTELEFDEASQSEIEDIHNVAEELRKDWIEQAGYINLLRDGTIHAEIPQLTWGEYFKLAFTQPALATMELLNKYFDMVARPLATWAVIHFPRINPDSDAAELEHLYNEYNVEGVSSWEALSLAWNAWDVNGAYKFFAETLIDPTTYLGIGIATRAATIADKTVLRIFSREAATALEARLASGTLRTGPALGRFAGAVERGWLEMWDMPFRAARNLIRKIPKTPTQKAVSFARQAFMDTRAFLRRYTKKDLVGITAPEARDALDYAVKQAMERPMETGDLAVRVGRYLTDYDFIERSTVSDWVNVVGGEGAQVTQQMVHDANFHFDLFFRKSYTANEAASNILASVGVEATARNVGKMATLLDRYSTKIVSGALDIAKGETARDILSGVLRGVEDMQIRKAASEVYQFALKSGRVTSWMGRVVDSVTRNSILAKLDRAVVAPMANQYLLFTNYGPFNILENVQRSFLGGGEMLYPRAASPVDELVRLGEGLSSLPYEMVVAQRELGRLEIAVIDPKTHRTMVFSKGKIPGVTKDLPFGVKINVAGKDYPIRSWQNWNDMFGDIGTKQRAYYLTTKYKQFLSELGSQQIDQIAAVFEKYKPILDEIKSINKHDKADFIRVLQQDATVGPDMVRKHDIPLPELERRKALREVNKLLDKCTDIYSPHKQTIRDGVLDGSIWKDVDGSIAGVRESIREFNIVSLQNEGQALDKLLADLKDFAPATGDEMLRNLGFISDVVDGISERIGEVRSITRSRAASLQGAEADNFHRAASETLGGFLGKSREAVDAMLDSIKRNISRPRTLLDDLTRNVSLGKPTAMGLKEVGFEKAPVMLDGEEIGSVLFREERTLGDLVIDELTITRAGVLDRGFMQDVEVLVHNLAAERNLPKVYVVSKSQHRLLYTRTGYTASAGGYVKNTMKPKPGVKLTPDQVSRLDALTDAIRLRHANAVAARDLDRKIINDAVAATPRNKRNKEWWDWLEQKRSTEAWEPYWAKEEELFNRVEDLKLGMMNSLGIDTTIPPTIPQVVDKLAPAHVAYMLGVAGDDMYRALTKVGAMTTIRSKNRFTTWVYRRANKAAAQFGKTAEEIGFSREAIGDVYDQMFQAVGIDPKFANQEALAPAMLQLEDVRQELHRQYGLKAIPENDYVKFKGYINSVADELDKSSIYTGKWNDVREEAMMKARTQYEMDFTDYENRNMVDAAMRMIYPFWTYEWQRWFWLPRAMLKTPGVATGIGRYMEYSDIGYIPIPGLDIQFNPLRGTVFMGGFRRLFMRDYPEYYDAFPGMEAIDFISRMGFYPGIHIMLPIVAFGAATGKPEWSEILPSWTRTVMDAARAIAPEQVGAVLDHIFPDRFRDYLTMLTLGSMGYDADEIWRKKSQGLDLTEEENKLWLEAEAKATGLKGILFEQTGVFRLRPEEYSKFLEDNKKLIEELTGVPVDVQDRIMRLYPVTGKRFSDYFKLDTLQQKIIYNSEQYKRWQGVTTPLLPSTWQQEDVRIRDYYETVQDIYADYRRNGVYDEQGTLVMESLDSVTRQWLEGTIGPDQWRSARGELLNQASAAIREISSRLYPDVPKTLEERAQRYLERGLPAPTYSADQELMYLYYDIKPELKYNWDSGRMEYDYDTYYAKIDALVDTLTGEYRQRFLDRVQYDWNGMEKLYWNISREFLRTYRLVRSLVLEQYTPEQQQQIMRFEVARGAEREELLALEGPGGEDLISGFQRRIREARLRLRYLDSELDAWCYFFGITDKLITVKAEETYNGLVKQYMVSSMAE